MPNKDKVLDDIARVAGGTVSVLSGLSKQVRDDLKSRVEDIAADLDLVPREDFERLEAMLEKALEQQKALEKRIAAIEGGKNKK